MKAVIYHANTKALWDQPPDLYETIFKWHKAHLNKRGVELIHLTTEGHEGWGDINYHFHGNPEEPMYNREVFFTRFLRDYADNGIYWFTEPDVFIVKPFCAA